MTRRLFVGVDLPGDITEPLILAAELIRAEPDWAPEKWVDPGNLHLTLAFFGEVPEAAIPDLAAALGRMVTRSHCAFSVDRLVAMPNERRCAMVWGVLDDLGGRGASLAGTLRTAASSMGVPADGKAFTPHVTLCRARRPHPAPTDALARANRALPTPPRVVSDPPVTLYQSRLTPHGPQYRAIATWHAVGE